MKQTGIRLGTGIAAWMLAVTMAVLLPEGTVKGTCVETEPERAAVQSAPPESTNLPGETLPSGRPDAARENAPKKEDATGAEHSPRDESASRNDPSSETGTASRSEPSSEAETGSRNETSSEAETVSQSESASETESSSQSESSPETEKPERPHHYLVRILNAAAVLPEGGRVYDGTDKIDLTFQTSIHQIPEETGGKDGMDEQEEESASEEKTPEYHVVCSARLESADAGERKVVCSFTLQTPSPEYVKLDETTTHPDLKVTVRKALLSVRIADGTKLYGDPADLEHIHFEEETVIRVSGFVRNQAGEEIIPEGFEPPQPEVNPSVLQRWSPMYEPEGEDPAGAVRVRQYQDAILLKKDAAGVPAGNPTANYAFCSDPGQKGFESGTVTILRAPLKRDVSYELKGGKGAFRMDENGGVIVRAGTALRAEPLPEQGYNSGARLANITGDTVFRFRLEMRGPDGALLADSEEERVVCRADGSTQTASFRISGASSSGGLLFSPSSALASIKVAEDDVSGLDSILYRTLSAPLSTENVQAALRGSLKLSPRTEWKETGQTGSVPMGGEGIFAVEAWVRDRVGNESLAQSEMVVIDASDPTIEITGAEDGSANASTLHIQARCLDASFLPGSMKAEMKADFGGIIPAASLREESGGGALLTFGDFPRRREADAVYHLTVTASDRAGNQSKRQLSFSVNRFGSTYGLSDSTRSMLSRFYHTKPFDVTFLETNLDRVGEAKVLLRAGENMRELHAGSELAVQESRSTQGRSEYTYTVPASSFRKDGTYEVMLVTTDRAGNASDSSAQRLPVRFAIDTAAPEFLVSGIRPEGRYQERELTAVVEIRDNQALDKAEVYVNSGKIKDPKTEPSGSAGRIIKIPLSEKESWQTVQVHAADKAGNEAWTAEIPVYISSKDPSAAKDYRKDRLSAQQIALIRKSLTRLWSYFGQKVLFRSRPLSGTGIVRNLYQAQRMDAMRQTSPVPDTQVTASRLLTKAGEEDKRLFNSAFRIALALFAGITGLGIFLYRRWYVR